MPDGAAATISATVGFNPGLLTPPEAYDGANRPTVFPTIAWPMSLIAVSKPLAVDVSVMLELGAGVAIKEEAGTSPKPIVLSKLGPPPTSEIPTDNMLRAANLFCSAATSAASLSASALSPDASAAVT